MPKKAQDFLIDTELGDKSFDLKAAETGEEKIVLSIEEGAVPVALLKEAQRAKKGRLKSFFIQLRDALNSMGVPQAKDMATFFRLLAIMINAGIPLIKSLDTISEQTVNKKLRNSVFEIARAVEKGSKFSEGMTHYPDIFAESHIGMVKSGESSGQLNVILKQLAIEVEKSASIKRKVKGALIYPTLIVIVMIIVVSAMMIFVVPQISQLFAQSGQELPLITRIVVGASNFMINKWPIIFGVILGLILAVSGVKRTQQGKYTTDLILLNIPLFGKLVQQSILARFCRSLANLLTSGVPIVQGLAINAKGIGNEVYKNKIMLASEDIARGIPLGESLRDSPEFPDMMVQMIGVGEQTAQLDTIALKIAEYYEDEVDTSVAALSKAMEPAILIVVGGVVGAIVAAIMMPIMSITEMAGNL